MAMSRFFRGALTAVFAAGAASALWTDHQLSSNQGRTYNELAPIPRAMVEARCESVLFPKIRDETLRQEWCKVLLFSWSQDAIAQVLEEGREGVIPTGLACLAGVIFLGASALRRSRSLGPTMRLDG